MCGRIPENWANQGNKEGSSFRFIRNFFHDASWRHILQKSQQNWPQSSFPDNSANTTASSSFANIRLLFFANRNICWIFVMKKKTKEMFVGIELQLKTKDRDGGSCCVEICSLFKRKIKRKRNSNCCTFLILQWKNFVSSLFLFVLSADSKQTRFC